MAFTVSEYATEMMEQVLRGRYLLGSAAPKWADVVLDLRLNHTDTGLLRQPLPAPGVPGENNGVFHIPTVHPITGDDARDTISWHLLGHSNGNDAIYTVKVSYADGFTAAYVSSLHRSGRRRRLHPAEVFSDYCFNAPEGFTAVISRAADMHANTTETKELINLARTAVRGFRNALLDPTSWFSADGNILFGSNGPATPDHTSARADMVRWSTYGAPDFLTSARLSKDSDAIELEFAVRAGFDVFNPEDVDWICAASKRGWASQHHERWDEVRRLRDEGWTLPALRVLHSQTPAPTRFPRGDWDETTSLAEWLDLLDTPAKASAYISAGLTSAEARELINAGTPPSEDTLGLLAALREGQS